MNRGSIPYSAEELAFIEQRQSMTRSALHAAFVDAFQRADVTRDHIKALCVRRGWIKQVRFTDEDDAILREKYPHLPTAKVAEVLQRDIGSVYRRASRLGLSKSEAYLASPDACRLRRGDNVGAEHRFKKGQTPPNKGLRRPGWSPGRMNETQFAPGQKGWNWKPIGSTRVIDGYEYTKVKDVRRVRHTVNWKPTHIMRWEAVNGPVPKGHALKSLDGNRLNTDPTNWKVVPRSMLPRLNGGRGKRIGYDEAPPELKPTIMAVATLEHAAHKRKNNKRPYAVSASQSAEALP